MKMKICHLPLDQRMEQLTEALTNVKTPTEDVFRRTINLASYIKIKTCIELGWDNAQYYRKMRGDAPITDDEKTRYVEIVAGAMKECCEYIYNTCIQPSVRA